MKAMIGKPSEVYRKAKQLEEQGQPVPVERVKDHLIWSLLTSGDRSRQSDLDSAQSIVEEFEEKNCE